MMASSQAPTSFATVTASFPPMVASIVGELTLQELIRIQDIHMIPCAQSHVTTISALNFLHLCVPANIYTQYTNEPYPENPEDPGPWDGADEETPLGRTTAKSDWDLLNTDFWDTWNMNRAPVNRFLAQLNAATLQAFQEFYQQNPNMVFGRVFQWFLER